MGGASSQRLLSLCLSRRSWMVGCGCGYVWTYAAKGMKDTAPLIPDMTPGPNQHEGDSTPSSYSPPRRFYSTSTTHITPRLAAPTDDRIHDHQITLLSTDKSVSLVGHWGEGRGRCCGSRQSHLDFLHCPSSTPTRRTCGAVCIVAKVE